MMVLEWLFGSWCGLLFLLAMIAVGVRVCRRFLDFIDRHPLLLPSLWERRLELCSQLWQVMAANGRLEYLIPLGYFIRSMFNACVIMFFMILILLVYPAMSQAGPKGPWFAYPFIVCAARFNTEVRLLRNDLDKLQGKNETPSVDKDQLERENAHLRAEVDKYRKYATYYEEQWDRTLNNRYAADQNADQESELQRKRFEQELDAQESRYHAKINRFLNTAAEQQSKDEKTIKDQRRGIASLEKEIAEIREELKVPTNCEEHAKVITGYQSQLEMIKGDLDHQTGQLADAFEDASRTKKDSEDERKAWKEAEERLRTKLERAEDKYNLYWRRSKDSENACSRLTRRCERLATDLKSAEKVIEHCPTSSKALSLVKSRNKRLTSCLTNFVDSEERITAAYQEVLAKYNKLLTVHNDYKAPEAEALAEALHKVADLQKSLSTAEEKFEGLCKKTAKLHIELHLLKSSTDPKNSEHTETLAKVQTLEEELRTALNCNSKVCEELEALKAKQSSYDSKEEAVRRSSAKIESLTRRLEQADKLVENLRKGTSVDGASQEGGDTATGKRSPHEKEQPVAEMVKDQAKRKFNASFSNGYDCIKTDSKDCLCGFDAVIKSLEAMRLNDPNLPVPSIKDLMAGWKSEANVERWRDIFGEETPMTENWFAPDEISVALSYWAAAYTKDHGLENKLKLQIGLYKKVSVANQKGTYITPGYEAPKLEHCAFADDPDCKVVWIHHDGLAHYEGMKNRGRQG
ncbi:MAG: hypothetical protein L6R40_008273 [Gallowayella cf. fulva]|nr:MAG: hypothetical protein L6R40_008273 [Xanthomendoza cf. fulva]